MLQFDMLIAAVNFLLSTLLVAFSSISPQKATPVPEENEVTKAFPSAYGGGGVAVLADRRDADAFIVLYVGIEAAPGAGSGWFAELGVGGGVRAAVGWRLR